MLTAVTWLAACLGLVMLLFAGIELDIYRKIPTAALDAFESLWAVALGFAVAAVAAWIDVGIIAEGRKRAAIDAVG
ncbi:MAG TPA: hypothetical protein VG407_13045 [Caulobacteraceae bacterium]|jgi:hypothetical protein|nr:hypothetical protein [Caulobacteraceae bacterium]